MPDVPLAKHQKPSDMLRRARQAFDSLCAEKKFKGIKDVVRTAFIRELDKLCDSPKVQQIPIHEVSRRAHWILTGLRAAAKGEVKFAFDPEPHRDGFLYVIFDGHVRQITTPTARLDRLPRSWHYETPLRLGIKKSDDDIQTTPQPPRLDPEPRSNFIMTDFASDGHRIM